MNLQNLIGNILKNEIFIFKDLEINLFAFHSISVWVGTFSDLDIARFLKKLADFHKEK